MDKKEFLKQFHSNLETKTKPKNSTIKNKIKSKIYWLVYGVLGILSLIPIGGILFSVGVKSLLSNYNQESIKQLDEIIKANNNANIPISKELEQLVYLKELEKFTPTIILLSVVFIIIIFTVGIIYTYLRKKERK